MNGRSPRTTPSRAPFNSPGAACHTCRSPVLDGLRAHYTDPEADAPYVGGADFDVGDLGGLHQESPALLVGQREHARILGQRIGDQLLHLSGSLRAVEVELARAVRDTDLDLHAGPFPCLCGRMRSPERLVDASGVGPAAPVRG